MSLTDELERLHALHRSGALSAAEFQSAKERLLTGSSANPPPAPATPAGIFLGKRMELEAELARVDREFEMIRQECLVRTRHGHSSEPSEANGATLVFGLVIFVPICLYVFSGFMRHGGPMAVMPLVMGIFGGVMMISAHRSNRTKLDRLTAARARWQEARSEVLARISALGP